MYIAQTDNLQVFNISRSTYYDILTIKSTSYLKYRLTTPCLGSDHALQADLAWSRTKFMVSMVIIRD